MPDQDCGSQSRTPYGYFDPASCSWRTSQHFEIGDKQRCSHRFTKSGMTRSGRVYELQISAPRTIESGGSRSPLLPTVRAADGKRGPTLNSTAHEGGKDLVTVVVELYRERPEVYFKTPTANLGTNGSAQHPDKRKAGGHGPNLQDEVCFLLDVTPESQPADGPHSPPEWWGKFGPAVRRWETLTGKAAPVPVMRGPRGGLKLSPRFCEWMMGLPDGWVTDVPGITVNEQLARIGNGVAPFQAYHAFKLLLEVGDET